MKFSYVASNSAIKYSKLQRNKHFFYTFFVNIIESFQKVKFAIQTNCYFWIPEDLPVKFTP